jgi:hypothetical protein
METNATIVDINDGVLCDLVSGGLLRALHYPAVQLSIDLYSYEAEIWIGNDRKKKEKERKKKERKKGNE